MRVILVLMSVLVSSCASIGLEKAPTTIMPYVERPGDADKYQRAEDFLRVGKQSEASEIYYELAKSGYPKALHKYALKKYDYNGRPVLRNSQSDKGCYVEKNHMRSQYEKPVKKVHWAVRKLAMQGDPLAAKTYFNCYNDGNYNSVRGDPKLALEYVAGQGDIEAQEILIEYGLSWFKRYADNPKIVEPTKSANYSYPRKPNMKASKYWIDKYNAALLSGNVKVGSAEFRKAQKWNLALATLIYSKSDDAEAASHHYLKCIALGKSNKSSNTRPVKYSKMCTKSMSALSRISS